MARLPRRIADQLRTYRRSCRSSTSANPPYRLPGRVPGYGPSTVPGVPHAASPHANAQSPARPTALGVSGHGWARAPRRISGGAHDFDVEGQAGTDDHEGACRLSRRPSIKLVSDVVVAVGVVVASAAPAAAAEAPSRPTWAGALPPSFSTSSVSLPTTRSPRLTCVSLEGTPDGACWCVQCPFSKKAAR